MDSKQSHETEDVFLLKGNREFLKKNIDNLPINAALTL
tara:strand:- start:40 stop:153 length:114 start_codon:yes stop_codon:yes gene_type:complete